MSYIKKGLYIGNFRDAQDINFLQRNGITHVLCSAAELYPVYPGRFEYKHVRANDIPSFQLSRHFDQGADFIHDGVKNGGNVFVHCAAGISRSVSLALAYLVKHEDMKLAEAFNLIKAKRFIANPNPGFMKQLRDFEVRVHNNKQKDRLMNEGNFSNIPKTGNPISKLIFTQEENMMKPKTPLQPEREEKIQNQPLALNKSSTQPIQYGVAPGIFNPYATKPTAIPPIFKEEKSLPKVDQRLGQPVSLTLSNFNNPNNQLNRTNPSFYPTMKPAKMSELNMKQNKESNLTSQADFRLTGISVGKQPMKPKTPVQKPPLLYNDSAQAVDLRGNPQERARSNLPPQNADLYNRYLKMTLPGGYQEPRIATYNQRTNSQQTMTAQMGRTTMPKGFGPRANHQVDAFGRPVAISPVGFRSSARSDFYY